MQLLWSSTKDFNKPVDWKSRSSRMTSGDHQTTSCWTEHSCQGDLWTRNPGWPIPRKSSSSWSAHERRTCCPGRHVGSHSWWWYRRWPASGLLGCCAPAWWPSAYDRSLVAGKCWWAAGFPSSSICLSPRIKFLPFKLWAQGKNQNGSISRNACVACET